MTQVSHLHWQHKVQPGALAAWGELAVGLEDLEQCMRTIALTPKLSVPTEPEQFCDAINYIDRPPAVAIPNVTRELWDALARWEPRIILHEIHVSQIAFEHFKARIDWRPVEDVASEIRQTVIDLKGAA